jgi:ribonuclease T2
VEFLRTHKGKVVLAIVVITVTAVLVAWFSGGRSPLPVGVPSEMTGGTAGTSLPARVAASFDFYLLALTLHPAFCAEHRGMRECRTNTHRALAIHGLWPERFEPRTYPRDCPAPALQLDPGLEQRLADFMPGMAADLHEHEWREHGGCSGLDDDVYFSRTLELARELDAALGARLTTLQGRETTPEELREAANHFRPGIGATFTLHCRTLRGASDRPALVEIRQCIDNDGQGGAPHSLLDCGALRRRDQGCGAVFRVVGDGG